MEVVALTGPMASGKGEVVKYLMARGWQMVRFSDVLKDELERTGKELVRENYRDLGNGWRAEYGAGVLGKKLAEKILQMEGEKFLCDGLRHPQEIVEIKKIIPQAKLLGIVAPMEVLVERVMSRGRDIDDMGSREDVEAMIQSEMAGSDGDMQIGKCLEVADKVIENVRDLDYLHGEVDQFLNS